MRSAFRRRTPVSLDSRGGSLTVGCLCGADRPAHTAGGRGQERQYRLHRVCGNVRAPAKWPNEVERREDPLQ
eukprot:4559864-Pyramimonas_sp.AAC.1